MISGAKMWFNRPQDSPFTLPDIVHGLSQINRFGGQTSFPYSVAQHSCYVCDLLGGSRWGLMHDAAEALLGSDICRPLKYAPGMSPLRKFERLAQLEVARRFNLPRDIPPEVKIADDQMFLCEQTFFFGYRDPGGVLEERVRDLLPANVTIVQWSERRARLEFMDRFEQLFHAGDLLL